MVYAVTEGSLLEIPEGPLGKLIAGNDALLSEAMFLYSRLTVEQVWNHFESMFLSLFWSLVSA